MNPSVPSEKQALEKRTVRKATDYAELKPIHSASLLILRNIKNKGTYQGHVSDGLPQGWVVLIFKEGEILEGIFEKGKPARRLRYVYSNGKYTRANLKMARYQVEEPSTGQTVLALHAKHGQPGSYRVQSRTEMPMESSYSLASRMLKASQRVSKSLSWTMKLR